MRDTIRSLSPSFFLALISPFSVFFHFLYYSLSRRLLLVWTCSSVSLAPTRTLVNKIASFRFALPPIPYPKES